VRENRSIKGGEKKNFYFFIIISLFDNSEEIFGFHYQLVGGCLVLAF
jgi:hypothetical protein